MFPDEEEYEYIAPYEKGGVVNVPNASTEPDEKKVRGLPFTYAELGGVLAQDVEVLESEYGYNIADKTNLTTTLSDDGNQYGLTYSKFIPIGVASFDFELKEMKNR